MVKTITFKKKREPPPPSVSSVNSGGWKMKKGQWQDSRMFIMSIWKVKELQDKGKKRNNPSSQVPKSPVRIP